MSKQQNCFFTCPSVSPLHNIHVLQNIFHIFQVLITTRVFSIAFCDFFEVHLYIHIYMKYMGFTLKRLRNTWQNSLIYQH